MAFNTGNPVGSTDARDLSDNAENFDQFANGTLSAYDDRLGKSRKSIAGMESDFADFLASSGYEFLGDYAAGITVTAYNQVIRETGEFWRALAGASALALRLQNQTPAPTSGRLTGPRPSGPRWRQVTCTAWPRHRGASSPSGFPA